MHRVTNVLAHSQEAAAALCRVIRELESTQNVLTSTLVVAENGLMHEIFIDFWESNGFEYGRDIHYCFKTSDRPDKLVLNLSTLKG